MAALSDSASPGMGMRTSQSADARTAADTPRASEPTTQQARAGMIDPRRASKTSWEASPARTTMGRPAARSPDTVLSMGSSAISGTVMTDPAEDRTTLPLNGSTVRGLVTTPAPATALTVRMIVPRFPGSLTSSAHTIGPGRPHTSLREDRGCRQIAMRPWGVSVSHTAAHTESDITTSGVTLTRDIPAAVAHTSSHIPAVIAAATPSGPSTRKRPDSRRPARVFRPRARATRGERVEVIESKRTSSRARPRAPRPPATRTPPDRTPRARRACDGPPRHRPPSTPG